MAVKVWNPLGQMSVSSPIYIVDVVEAARCDIDFVAGSDVQS